jgi:type II secretory pathway pseudopilin PulG
MRTTRRRSAGLSLVEVLIALAVVAIALFAILATQVGAFQASSQAREIADARDIATRGIADLRVAVISYAIGGGWDELRDCGVVAEMSFATLDYGSAQRPPATSSCSGQYVERAADGVDYSLRWLIGRPQVEFVESVAGLEVNARSPHVGMIQALIRLDWRRRGEDRSLSFEDFVSCIDVDVTLCPSGPPIGWQP